MISPPSPASASSPASPIPSLESLPIRPPRILVVDDDEMVRDIIRLALAQERFEVLGAEDGIEGVEVFSRLDPPPDLVIMDIVMPRMNGVEAARRIKTLSPQTPILFSSGYDSTSDVEGVNFDALTPFLKKPYMPCDLKATVRRLLVRRPAGAAPAGLSAKETP